MTPREQKAAHARASDKNVERRPHRALQQLATRCALPGQLDPELRAPMWAELQRIYAADLPVLPLYFRADSYILPKWLSGLVPTGHKYATTNWIEMWRVAQ